MAGKQGTDDNINQFSSELFLCYVSSLFHFISSLPCFSAFAVPLSMHVVNTFNGCLCFNSIKMLLGKSTNSHLICLESSSGESPHDAGKLLAITRAEVKLFAPHSTELEQLTN